MTLKEAMQIVEEVRLQTTATGQHHDRLRQAVELLKALVLSVPEKL